MADSTQIGGGGPVSVAGKLTTTGTHVTTGTSTVTASTLSDGAFGVHELVVELDFQGKTPTNTDNGMLKTVATLPANAIILEANVMCTETFAPNQTLALDLVSTATAVSANADTTAVLQIIDNMSFATSAIGTAGKGALITNGGLNTTGVTLALINRGTGNTQTILTAGKVLVYIKYVGQAAPVALTTL